MRRADNESAPADQVASVAEDLSLSRRVVGDTSTVLGVPGVAKGDGTDDAVAGSGVELLNGLVGGGGALTVATDDDFGLGALARGFADLALHVTDAGGVGTVREGVGVETGSVVNALDGGAEAALEAVADGGADDGTLGDR